MFYDATESTFYGRCVERLVFRAPAPPRRPIRELGTGTGRPVIDAILRSRFPGTVHGYELDPAAHAHATRLIAASGLRGRYRVFNRDFFADRPYTEPCAIANPPYLPAPTADIRSPGLWGGVDGSAVSRRILDAGFDEVMLVMSSYANPLALVEAAGALGYALAGALVSRIRFGPYSRDRPVHEQIRALAAGGRAFIADDTYLLMGTLWSRTRAPTEDRAHRLHTLLTHFGTPSPAFPSPR